MIRQCAWCLLLMGEVAPLHDKNITHGICTQCEKKLMGKIEQDSKKVGTK